MTGTEHARLSAVSLTTHVVDDIVRFESQLSEGLPTDPDAAKEEVLRRLEHLDHARISGPKDAALGLANAIQTGVDRTPAIVFDAQAVVYGVTDLVEALDRYEAWRQRKAQ